jgi:hypothetical protein
VILLYDNFYRKFGIRRADQLLTPPLPAMDQLSLPKRSLLHFVTTSPLEGGPPSDDFMFREIVKPIQMQHVLEVGDTKGNPRLLSFQLENELRKYHIRNRRFRRAKDFAAASRDENSLVVMNYGFISHRYRYVRSVFSEYHKWWNIEAAMWKEAGELASTSDRHQFLVVKLPVVLPSLTELGLASKEMTANVLKKITTQESWFIIELWKWFGEERATSMLNAIPANRLDRMNLIFQESGRWFVMNLGVMNTWRQTPDNEIVKGADGKPVEPPNKKGISPEQFQRRFLRLLISLFQVRSAGVPDTQAPVVDKAQTVVIKQPVGVPTVNTDTGVVEAPSTSSVIDDNDPTLDIQDTKPEEIQFDASDDHQLEADLAELEKIAAIAEQKRSDEPALEIQEAQTLESGVIKVCDRLADSGMLSAAEYRRYSTIASAYRSITAPDGKGTLEQFIRVDPEVLKITESPTMPDIKTVIDKTMLKSSLLAFDQRYIEKVMARDVAAMVLNVQNAGIAVTDYQVERVDSILGSYDDFIVRVNPVEGSSSTLRFKLPAVDSDGTFTANGVKYRMRKQRGDLPIRKIGPDRVALTSYYGKIFATRSSKRVNDYGQWLRNHVMAKGLDQADMTITDLHPANVFDNMFPSPRLYSMLSMGFRGFKIKAAQGDRTNGYQSFDLIFDHTKREAAFGADTLKTYEKDGSIVVGANQNGQFLVMDKHSSLYAAKDGKLGEVQTFEDFIGIDIEKAPVEFAELKVLGRTIPMGIILGYELGLERLMKLLRVVPRRVQAGTRVNLEAHEYSIVFADETLVFSKDDRLAAMIMGGFNEYHKTLRGFSVYEFDRRNVYLNVLESSGASVRYLREIDLLYQLFIDPITRDLLVEMQEPTDFHGLLMRACELLLVDQHPDELDPAWMRIKGYERMAGAAYSEIVRSIRAHNARPGKSRVPIDLNPYAVWKSIAEDPSKEQVCDINPIQNLKEMEAVTFSGTGGRNSRSMTKHTRAYHRNDMGTISESTVDSSDVAINTYTSADPQFTSLRGISKRYDTKTSGATALLSTSALISPAADRDDPKRVNFIAIQHRHGIACNGYGQLPIRTGYEQVIAHRTSDLYAMSAKKAGKVLSVTESGITVEYEDGEVKGYELGRRYGNAAGLVVPHTVTTELKAGQTFKEGEFICYNTGFFERDILNPNNIVWKGGIVVKTALMESTATLEDASLISKKTAALLSTPITKVKTIVVNFDQSVRKLVKVGDTVNSENILCIIEDAVTANSNLFDEESLDTLRLLSGQTPQAKAKGVIERIEVFYHGDKEDMSESLRAIANKGDRELAQRCKDAGKKAYTGSVDEGFRVDGEPLAFETMAIRVYITSEVAAGVGDKGVFCNQLKTVFSEIAEGELKTESGKEIGAIFGAKSIADRIVLSPDVIGTTTTLLDVIAKKALEAYRKS